MPDIFFWLGGLAAAKAAGATTAIAVPPLAPFIIAGTLGWTVVAIIGRWLEREEERVVNLDLPLEV